MLTVRFIGCRYEGDGDVANIHKALIQCRLTEDAMVNLPRKFSKEQKYRLGHTSVHILAQAGADLAVKRT